MVVTDTAWVPASRLSLPETPAEVHVPFAPKSLIQAVHDGVWFGFNASGTIHKLSLTGDTMARIVLSRPAARVTAAERAEAIAAWRARLGRMGAGPGSAPAPELPTRKPIYSRFIPSSDGGLGVVPVVNPRRQDSEIDLFDRTGRFRGTAHLPFRLAAVAAGVVLGQRLLLALEMPNGEERVYRFDLVP